MNIYLFCASGVSTGVLVHNMNKYKNEEDLIEAYEFQELSNVIGNADVVLIAPQLKFRMPIVKKICVQYQKIYVLLNWKIYASMDGETAYEIAYSALQNKRSINE